MLETPQGIYNVSETLDNDSTVANISLMVLLTEHLHDTKHNFSWRRYRWAGVNEAHPQMTEQHQLRKD